MASDQKTRETLPRADVGSKPQKAIPGMIWLKRPSDLRQGKKAKRRAFQALRGERVKATASKRDAQGHSCLPPEVALFRRKIA